MIEEELQDTKNGLKEDDEAQYDYEDEDEDKGDQASEYSVEQGRNAHRYLVGHITKEEKKINATEMFKGNDSTYTQHMKAIKDMFSKSKEI